MKKIILAGASLHSGNKGVNALTRGQIMLIFDMYGVNTEVEILSYTVNESIENIIDYKGHEIIVKEIPCRMRDMMSSYVKLKTFGNSTIISKIKEADYIWDISEGDSFSDIYGVKRFIQHSLIKLITISTDTKLVIMPQTLGPFKRGWVKKIAKKILKKADYVFARDEISIKIVKESLNIERNISFIPDMAFYMNPDERVSINKFINNEKIKVGINISALLYNGGYNKDNMFNFKISYHDLINHIIEKFSKINNVEIILIPHVMKTDLEVMSGDVNLTEEMNNNKYSVEDDFVVCNNISKELGAKLRCKIHTLDKLYREDELKAIISGCDFFIGSRMHACIGAISTLVPTVPIAYSRKFIGIWEKIGLSYCVTDPKKQDEEEIVKIIFNLFEKRNNIRIKLEDEIPKLREQIRNMISIIEES